MLTMARGSFARRQLNSAGICLVFVLLNWHVETQFFRPVDGRLTGLHIEYGPMGVAFAIAAGLTLWCLWGVCRNLWRAARAHVPVNKRPSWGDCVPLLYLLPLLFRFEFHSSWTDPYGRAAQTVYCYGHMPHSLFLFFLAVAGVFCFQIRARVVAAINIELQKTRSTG